MKVYITSWYMDTVNDIIHNNIDSETIPTLVNNRREEIVYELNDESLLEKYTSWLNHAGYCELVKSYRIER